MYKKFLDALTFTPLSLQFPEAWVGHLAFAAWLVREQRPKTLVELGTHFGNSYFAFCQSIKAGQLDTATYAVDTWLGDEHATFYQADAFQYVSRHNADHYAAFSRLLRMTFDEALEHFSDGAIELLHIDGFHTYEAVSHDFTTWEPKLAPGAIVLFHDVNVREKDFGVWRFWEELCALHSHTFTFLHCNGLGVLQMPGGDPEKLLPCFTATPEERQELRDIFSAVGATHQYRYQRNVLEEQLAEEKRVVKGKDDALQVHLAALEEHKEIFDAHHAIIDARDAELAQLRCELEEQCKIAHERQCIVNEQHAVILERDAALQEQDVALQERDERLALQEKALQEAGERLVAHTDELRNLYTSKCWRMTAPLRGLSSLLR